jgi:hypothetical protein
MGLLFIPQIIYESGEPWWNDIDKGKLNNSETNLFQCHFVHHKAHMDLPGCEPGPQSYGIYYAVSTAEIVL